MNRCKNQDKYENRFLVVWVSIRTRICPEILNGSSCDLNLNAVISFCFI